ncbi:hypothetical protein ACFSCX_24820 [Bacillus salitolerans]|uniref:Uncharacterized protein n=1 Tax=Bacillus salitolerans TaxID=1437434 RepID=A0ABW4LWZ9_9BACI
MFTARGILKNDTTKTSYTVTYTTKGLSGDLPFIEAINRLARQLEANKDTLIPCYDTSVKDYTKDGIIVCAMIRLLCNDEVKWEGNLPELDSLEDVLY